MSFFLYTLRGCRLAMVTIVMLALVITPFSPKSIPVAEAGPAVGSVVVVGGNGTVQDSISAGANVVTAGIQEAFFIKEFTLDGIAHGLAKLVLKSMTQSILNWINSGFQGKPAFVTDLKQFILDRIDQTVGEYIYNDPALNFLCSPFQLDVKIALTQSYQQTAHDGFGSKAQCTLSEVTDNVEGFLSGSFSEGGWQSWFEVTQNPVNTPTGALLEAEVEMYARIIDEQGNTIKELDWGDGFLSFKVCSDTSVATGAQKNCNITTPGRVIADQINKSLGAGQDELIAADEINEIISALFAQLAQQAITGIYGLLGLGGSSYSDNRFGANGTSSYLTALDEATEGSRGINPFTKAIAREEENTTLLNQGITIINAAENKLDSAIALYGSCINLSLPDEIIDERDTARIRIIKNTQNIAALSASSATFQTSTSSEEQLALVTALLEKQQNGTYTGITENSLLKVDIEFKLQTAVDTFERNLTSAINNCNDSDAN